MAAIRQRPQLELITQYLEVNFDNLTEELAGCLSRESPSVLRQQEAASHLRSVIRVLMTERAAGGDVHSASQLVEGLPDLSDAEKGLLRRRLADIAERVGAPAAAVPDPVAPARREAGTGTNGNGRANGTGTGNGTGWAPSGRRPISERAGLGAAGVTTVLQALASKALEHLSADFVQVFLESGDLLVLQAEAPEAAESVGPVRLAPEEGLAGRARAASRATTMEAARVLQGAELTWARRGAQHLAAVPMGSAGDGGAGLLVAARVTPQPFGHEDLVEMARLADEVTLTLASADLLSRAEELAVLKERMSLAREIHDGLASDLSAVVQMFKYYEHRRQADPEDAERLLLQMRELVEGALQSARDILSALRPRQQTPRQLSETLKQLVEAFSRTYGVSGVARIVGEDNALVAEEREAIFQVVRESLTNIRKHSQCTSVQVTLDMTNRPFVLVVEDDGIGFDPVVAEEKTGSFGLLGMKERAQLLGGTLLIGSSAMGGARLEFHGPQVPLGA